MTSVYDVVVVGGTPSGVMAAVHAARGGYDTCLVAINDHLGGMMGSGLSVTDTMFGPDTVRAPLLDEFFEQIRTHYRETYGENSAQYEICNEGLFFEPHVAENVFANLIDESGLTVRKQRYPVSAERVGRRIRAVTLESFTNESQERIEASIFIDATYEGDLAAVAGVPYRVGREPASEYGEHYAGRVFTDADDVSSLRPGTTGDGDSAVQSYNYRLCLSRDPDNQRAPEKPERYDRREYLWVIRTWEEMGSYVNEHDIDDGMEVGLRDRTSTALADTMDRWVDSEGPPVVDDRNRWTPLADDPYRGKDPIETELLPCPAQTSLLRRSRMELTGLLEGGAFEWGKLPNDKHDLNTCDLVGESDAYPEADWPKRREIAKRHREYVLGFLYFLRNDSAVPEELQEMALEWGLATDEFTDNDNVPWQLYVREARRIRGRETFTEQDALLASNIDRASINETAIAIAEYPLDAHDVRPVRRTDTAADGRFFLTAQTVPSQIPYGTIVPENVNNLLVPVAVSASHVGFQTIRLEPTWIQLGEAAGIAAVLALEHDTVPSELNPVVLQERLVEAGSMLSFFTGFDMATEEPWVPAVQFLGTKGFFRSYDARPNVRLDSTTANEWAHTTADLLGGDLDATERAQRLIPNERGCDISADEFATEVDHACERIVSTDIERALDACDFEDPDTLLRSEACQIIYNLITRMQ